MITISALLASSLFLPAIAKQAGKFSLPLTRHGANAQPQSSIQPRGNGNAQEFMNMGRIHESIFTNQHPHSSGNPIDAPYSPLPFYKYYTTNLSVGTPPQPFRAVVDLDWADLILPSSTCISGFPRFCNPSNNSYNSNASSTYIDHFNGTHEYFRYGPVYGQARLSEDVLTLTDEVQVPSQLFHAITRYLFWYGRDWRDPFPDGVLGLAIGQEHLPGEFGMPSVLPSPFRSMVDQNVLEKNMFSIVFPTEEREQGSLTFGGYDEDLLDGPLVSHAIYPLNTTSWQFEIESVSMRGTYNCVPNQLLTYHKTPTTQAWLMSTRPTIGFHSSLANEIYYYIHGWNDGCMRYPRVPCNDISSLPDIIIGLKGQNITLRGKDYVSRVEVPFGGPVGCHNRYDEKEKCYVMIDWLGGPPGGSPVAILGTPFLERVMGVWDWDTRTISFGNLKQ